MLAMMMLLTALPGILDRWILIRLPILMLHVKCEYIIVESGFVIIVLIMIMSDVFTEHRRMNLINYVA